MSNFVLYAFLLVFGLMAAFSVVWFSWLTVSVAYEVWCMWKARRKWSRDDEMVLDEAEIVRMYGASFFESDRARPVVECIDCGRTEKELEQGNRMVNGSKAPFGICAVCLEMRR